MEQRSSSGSTWRWDRAGWPGFWSGPAAIVVAMQTGGPIGKVLAEVLEGMGEPPASLLGPVDGLPDRAVGVREVAAVLTARRV